MEEVFNRFLGKAQTNENIIYLFGGSNLSGSQSVSQFIGNNYDPENPPLIVAQSLENANKKEALFDSKYIICPLCKQSSIIKMKDFKINLSECKLGHEVSKITLDKFEEGQKIDYETIICQTCNKKRIDAFEHKFYTCLSCGKDICPFCKPKHAQHNVIDYEKKVYYCLTHGENFTKYCLTCKKNICISCENAHRTHETKSFGEMMPDKEVKKEKIERLLADPLFTNVWKKLTASPKWATKTPAQVQFELESLSGFEPDEATALAQNAFEKQWWNIVHPDSSKKIVEKVRKERPKPLVINPPKPRGPEPSPEELARKNRASLVSMAHQFYEEVKKEKRIKAIADLPVAEVFDHLLELGLIAPTEEQLEAVKKEESTKGQYAAKRKLLEQIFTAWEAEGRELSLPSE